MMWKSALSITHHLGWFVPVLAMLVLFGGRGSKRSARDRSDGSIEFAPSRIAFGAWLLLVAYLAHTTIGFFEHSHGQPFALVNVATAGFLTLAILFSFPGTLIITADGLQQVFWFWRNKRIRWEEIVEINTGKKDRSVTITGANGTKILHTRQLADRPRFLFELKRHCGANLPQDFPREPIVGV